MTSIIQACPNRVENPEDGGNYRQCLCGGYFPYTPKRGRPPNSCDYFKQAQPEAKRQTRATKRAEKEKSVATGLTPVPVLEQITDINSVKKGMHVYSYNTSMFTQDWSRRLHAKEYKVLSVDEVNSLVTVIRSDKKAHHEEIAVPLHKLRLKSGVEFMNVVTYEEGIVEEEDE